jgi:AcrR family transcriptional regulator
VTQLSDRAPARGTRPRNRRDIIIAAAAELFAAEGYANVGMGDIAAAVNVRPSALYRHFAGKQEILREAILRGARLRTDAVRLGQPVDLDDVLDDLARSALETRRSSSLWTQEVRNLDEEARQEIRVEFRALPSAFASKLDQVRPELSAPQAEVLAWSALDVLASISFHEEKLPPGQFTNVLRDCMARIIDLRLPGDRDPTPSVERPARGARREVVLEAAAQLFARRGYSAVTVEELGQAAGMSSAGLYTFFGSKQSLLATLVTRSLEWQQYAAQQALRGARTPREKLEALVDAYVDFTYAEPALVSVLLTETRSLMPETAGWVDQVVRDSVGEWIDLIRELDPDRDPTVTRIQVLAARMVGFDVLTTPSLRATPDLLSLVRATCRATLDI